MDDSIAYKASMVATLTVPIAVTWAPGMPRMLLSDVPFVFDPCAIPCELWFCSCVYGVYVDPALLHSARHAIYFARVVRGAL